ncbi:MAG TPA: hypothetical protein VGP08_13205 [Pyrinomonadaceae bacterium]|jgi:hypothetical protein|nr:hypothetical protein [Pyrinomonadaceae bacterium]
MNDAAALERDDTETRGTEPGLRVPFNADGESVNASEESRAHVDTRAAARRARLTRLLLAKLTLDLLFVAALAVYTQAVAFRPFYSGSLDYADSKSVRGWVVDRSEPAAAVEVQLYVDGNFAAAALADEPRPDVSEKGYAEDERHGYVFNLGNMKAGEHEARVYAVHASRNGARRTLQQIGGALRFKTEARP